jgi:hypothetical protein
MQLVGLAAPRVRSRSITEVMAIAQTQQPQQEQHGAIFGQGLAACGGSGNLSKSAGGQAGEHGFFVCIASRMLYSVFFV